MESLFIKVGNQIFNRINVCGVEYKTFSEEDSKLVGCKSKLRLFTVDGKEVLFANEQADILWTMFSESSLDLTPIKADVENL